MQVVCLDPTPYHEHTTVEKYHEEAVEQLGSDRRKMQVLLPFGEQWTALRDEVNSLNAEIDER